LLHALAGVTCGVEMIIDLIRANSLSSERHSKADLIEKTSVEVWPQGRLKGSTVGNRRGRGKFEEVSEKVGTAPGE